MKKKAPTTEESLGNRRTRDSSSKNWVFTFNNYKKSEMKELIAIFKKGSDIYIFGEEIAPTTGTPHLQGYVEFKKKCRPMERKDLFKGKIWWEKAKGTLEQNVIYTSKDNYKTNLPWHRQPLKLIKKADLFPWQEKVEDIIESNCMDRFIHWIWGDGNDGKTEFAKYLTFHHGAIPLSGKKNDILYMAHLHPASVYIIDIERSLEEHCPYGAIEKVKDGYFMSGKYEGGLVNRNKPHIFVFANFAPDESKMTEDRWKVKYLKPRYKTD